MTLARQVRRLDQLGVHGVQLDGALPRRAGNKALCCGRQESDGGDEPPDGGITVHARTGRLPPRSDRGTRCAAQHSTGFVGIGNGAEAFGATTSSRLCPATTRCRALEMTNRQNPSGEGSAGCPVIW